LQDISRTAKIMDVLISHTIKVFLAFFAIMNPIANTPIFIGLTSEDDLSTKKMIARRSLLLAFLVILIFCLSGKLIFSAFGITLPAFRITGGIIVFLIGFHMLQGEQSRVHNPSHEDNQKSLEAELSIAVTPLAIPILAGPGTITTAMSFSAGNSFPELAITICSFGALCFITYAFFIYVQRFVKYISKSTVKVISRMMGLILAVIGTQMVIQEIFGVVHMFNSASFGY